MKFMHLSHSGTVYSDYQFMYISMKSLNRIRSIQAMALINGKTTLLGKVNKKNIQNLFACVINSTAIYNLLDIVGNEHKKIKSQNRNK
jgi:hypothetical protein